MTRFAVVLIVGLGFSFCAHAETVTATGCAEKGVENSCVILKNGSATYDIGAAVPAPKLGEYGTVKGTVSDKMTTCMQGKLLDPATWTSDMSHKCPALQ